MFWMSENTIKVDIDRKINSRGLNVPIGGQVFDQSNTPLVNDSIGPTIRGYGIHEENGVVIFLDVLGMKGIWRRFKPINVIKMWNSIIGFFRDSLDQNCSYINAFPFFRALSDSIIIAIPSRLSSDIICRMFDMLMQPFTQSIKTRMLLRGTVSYGTYYYSDRLIIGPALDDAASHHGELDWIGIVLSPTTPINMNNVPNNSVTYYSDIPHKEGNYGGLVLNWPIFDSKSECYSVLQQEKINAEPSAKEKYDNTFGFYHRITNSI
jgi:hypothetical protein